MGHCGQNKKCTFMVENSHPLARNVIDTSKITLPGALGDIESAFVITMQATHYCVCVGGGVVVCI